MTEPKDNLRSVATQEQINLEGPGMRNRLIQANPRLNPKDLTSLVPAYAEFELSQKGFLWSRRNSRGLMERPEHSKVFLLLSGISAAGKHAVLDRIRNLLPDQITDLVTATTRPAKEKEQEGIDHYYYSLDRFLHEKSAGEFIEYIEQSPGRWYGTPKRAIQNAIARPEPVIVSDVEMGSGWPSVDDYVESLPTDGQPKVIKVFMLPEMTAQEYFGYWLPDKRPADQEARSVRAAWEIWTAPRKADFILTNPIGQGIDILNREARVLADQIQQFLLSLPA